MFLNWLGTRTFIANTTASGVAIGYFCVCQNLPLVLLLLLLWLTSLVTWAEYRSALANM